jgi:hypothetical protein
MGDNADDLDVFTLCDAAFEHLPVPALREPAGIGDDAMDDLRPSGRQAAEAIVLALDTVGRERRLATRAQRAGGRMSRFLGDRDPCLAVEPGARGSEALPDSVVRFDEILSYLNGIHTECDHVRRPWRAQVPATRIVKHAVDADPTSASSSPVRPVAEEDSPALRA